MIEIRPYREADELEVISLWREVFPQSPPWNDPRLDIQRKLAVQRDLFIVALDGPRIVGTAMAGYDGHRGWVYYVGVDPRFRRQGVGTTLMRRVEHDLERLGCPKLNLQVRTSNSQTAEFYRRLGYAVEDRLSMSKLLARPQGGS